jgi:hypothetical protein
MAYAAAGEMAMILPLPWRAGRSPEHAEVT